MNLFVLDIDPDKSAQYHCDKHVVQMIREGIWILEAAKWRFSRTQAERDGDPSPPGWVNHPLAKWASSSIGAWTWLIQHTGALLKEYTYRYGKVHAQQGQFNELAKLKVEMPFKSSPFVQIVPDDCKQSSAIDAYRLCYSKHKYEIAKWTKRDVPKWFNPFLTGRHE